MAQSFKCMTSGHDLTIHGFELSIGLHADSVEPAWDSLSRSLSLPHLCFQSVNQSINQSITSPAFCFNEVEFNLSPLLQQS